MKVLFCTRSNLHTHPAGDTVQIMHTAAYLRQCGVQVDFGGAERQISAYDLVHLFQLTPIAPAFACFQRAAAKGIPVVLTPIYWDLCDYYRFTGSTDRLLIWERSHPLRSEILRGCAQVYPSGERELELLEHEAKRPLPYTIIRGGIDTTVFHAPEEPTMERTIDVLCAARICPRKNQLALAQACARHGYRVALAGPAENPAYLGACLAYPNVYYEGNLHGTALQALYHRARVHALPSFVETPGLASLEAAASGCNVLSTSIGDAEEYFGDYASYCDPYEPDSVHYALENVFAHDTQPALGKMVCARFDWNHCLAPLWNSYCKLLG